LIVIKDDSKDKIEYRVKAKPPKKMDEEIKKAYEGMFVKVEKLFTGEDPFTDDFDNPEDASSVAKDIYE
jgi:hypothetical protein